MKSLLKIFYLIVYVTFLKTACGQTSEIFGKVKLKKTQEILPGASVILTIDTTTITYVTVDIDGNYKILVKPPGTYTLIARFIQSKETKIIKVSAAATKEIDFYIPFPCDEAYSLPIKCPDGLHTDNIIPIVYGLPSKKLAKQASKGKISLGGCIPSCEQYYCKTHNKSF